MAYECNVRARGLFRPQLHQLPSEHVVLYKQRDMTASHLYRVGGALFGSRGIEIRRRLVDSSLFSSTDLSPHARLFTTPLNGGPSRVHTGRKSAAHSHSDYSGSTTLPTTDDLDVRASAVLCSTKFNNLQWIGDRQRLRESIEGPDALKRWLMCKEQTPMESYLLSKMHTRKVGDKVNIIKHIGSKCHNEPGFHLGGGRVATNHNIIQKSVKIGSFAHF